MIDYSNLLDRLWERVVGLSQVKMNAVEADFTHRFKEQWEEAQKYKSNNQRWQQLFNQWQQKRETLLTEKLTLVITSEISPRVLPGVMIY